MTENSLVAEDNLFAEDFSDEEVMHGNLLGFLDEVILMHEDEAMGDELELGLEEVLDIEAEDSLVSSNLCLITSLPDSVLVNIASYSAPPDIYNLSQTCKDFHKPSTELSTRHILSPKKVFTPLEDDSHNDAVTNIASKLLNESLLQGLVRVLERSNASISIDQVKKFVKLQMDEMNQGRKVLLSGSAVVQAATGKRFDNYDLDIYCTKKSVPALRALLLSEFGMCCESVVPCYGENQECEYLGIKRSIHHVETYVFNSKAVKTVGAAKLARRYFRAINWAQQAGLEEAAQQAVQEETDRFIMSYMSLRNKCLHNFQKLKHHKFPNDYPFTMSPQGNGRKCIDLIVCRTSPEEALARFDLEICKCNFDGKSLHVVSIQDTFNSRTKSDDYMKFINHYLPSFLNPALEEHRTILSAFASSHGNALAHLSFSNASNGMMIHIMQCFTGTVELIDKRTQLTVLGTETFSLLDWETHPCYFLALHNKLVKQFIRALKYSKRGIQVPISDTLQELSLGIITPPPPKRARY
jgi:hypothetical protein